MNQKAKFSFKTLSVNLHPMNNMELLRIRKQGHRYFHLVQIQMRTEWSFLIRKIFKSIIFIRKVSLKTPNYDLPSTYSFPFPLPKKISFANLIVHCSPELMSFWFPNFLKGFSHYKAKQAIMIDHHTVMGKRMLLILKHYFRPSGTLNKFHCHILLDKDLDWLLQMKPFLLRNKRITSLSLVYDQSILQSPITIHTFLDVLSNLQNLEFLKLEISQISNQSSDKLHNFLLVLPCFFQKTSLKACALIFDYYFTFKVSTLNMVLKAFSSLKQTEFISLTCGIVNLLDVDKVIKNHINLTSSYRLSFQFYIQKLEDEDQNSLKNLLSFLYEKNLIFSIEIVVMKLDGKFSGKVRVSDSDDIQQILSKNLRTFCQVFRMSHCRRLKYL